MVIPRVHVSPASHGEAAGVNMGQVHPVVRHLVVGVTVKIKQGEIDNRWLRIFFGELLNDVAGPTLWFSSPCV